MVKWRLVAGLIGSLLASASASAAEPVARVESGTLEGTSQPGLNIFLGIPYAQAPIGDLRWRAPVRAAPWTGVRAAKSYSPACQQGDQKPFGPYTAAFLIAPEMSEDCLYLNIWAPAKGAAKRPVYVFVHGGGFQAGGTNIAAYDGAGLARKGAIVVTINYRLGMFGFFSHPDLARESALGTSGNYGILDTIEALRWVRSNIASFGGDPANVTLAGQSAGSGVVNALLVSPLAKGLFDKAVLESGPTLGLPMPSLAAAEAAGKASVVKAKVADLAGLRAIPADRLTASALSGIPLPIVDGKIIPADPEDRNTPLASKVPIIAGYNRDEAARNQVPQTVDAFEKDVRRRFGALADKFLALYPHATDAEAIASGGKLGRDRRVAGLILWAERRAAEGAPVFTYHFEHALPAKDSEIFGAFHTAEVPYIFGALAFADAAFTKADRKLSDEMQKRWLAFMRYGDPGKASGKPRWRRTSLDPASVWRIDPADTAPLLDSARLQLFREYVASGGKLGLL